MTDYRKRIALDFDGVLHSGPAPYTCSTEVNNPPTPGAFEWLAEMAEHFDVIIHTSRLAFDRSEHFHEDTPTHERVQALRDWFTLHGLPSEVLEALTFHTGRGKPHAHVYIDDRGFEFCGRFPTVEQLEAFEPWHTRTVQLPVASITGAPPTLEEAHAAGYRTGYGNGSYDAGNDEAMDFSPGDSFEHWMSGGETEAPFQPEPEPEFFWDSCSGCYESGENDGLAHNYPTHPEHGCKVGMGCEECNLQGVVKVIV